MIERGDWVLIEYHNKGTTDRAIGQVRTKPANAAAVVDIKATTGWKLPRGASSVIVFEKYMTRVEEKEATAICQSDEWRSLIRNRRWV